MGVKCIGFVTDESWRRVLCTKISLQNFIASGWVSQLRVNVGFGCGGEIGGEIVGATGAVPYNEGRGGLNCSGSSRFFVRPCKGLSG